MKNIVFIVYDMLPYSNSWGGCQRMYFLAKKLVEKGQNVKIFALNANKYNTYCKELLPNVEHTAKHLVKEQEFTSSASSESKVKDVKILRTLFHTADKVLFNEIIPGIGFRSYNKCRIGKDRIKEDLKDNHYDIAIVSAPPFNVFSYIKEVKTLSPKTKVVMDYRDPWNSWHSGNPFTTAREKKLQNLADLIVCTNDALCDDMSGKFNYLRDKYRTISNGYKGGLMTPEHKDGLFPVGKLNIAYTGTINFGPYCEPYRDSHNLLQAIKELKDAGVEDFCFTFVGIGDTNSSDILEIKKTLGDCVNFVGVVSSSMANQYVYESDIALVMHTAKDNSGRYLISGKLYDYIHNKKFVLSVAKSNSQHAVLLKKNNIGLNAENTVADIKEKICQCIQLWKANQLNTKYEKVDVEVFSRDYQVEKYCEIIEQI